MDSMLVVNQMMGKFKVRNRDLWPIHRSIKRWSMVLKKLHLLTYPGSLINLADVVVNRALDDELAKLEFSQYLKFNRKHVYNYICQIIG